jgi:DNA invertase Pin-like site-specific DNA recombinase
MSHPKQGTKGDRQDGKKRGRKTTALPQDKIRELNNAGQSSRTIAEKLKAEYDINVSYRTVQRVVAGKPQTLNHNTTFPDKGTNVSYHGRRG